MKRIVFIYWLLLPFYGLAQGIEINEGVIYNGTPSLGTDYESAAYEPSAKYYLKDTNLYRQKGVQRLELFDGGKKPVFRVVFDRQGRVVQLATKGKDNAVLINTDVIPGQDRLLTVVSYYVNDVLLRVDTTTVEHITEYRRHKSPFSYDLTTFRSYKSGRYLAERNDYYKNFLTDGTCTQVLLFTPPYGRYMPLKRIDGNADKPFPWPATPGSRLLLRRGVDRDRFYLTQQTKTYDHISGASAGRERRLLGKASQQYFMEGESLMNCCFGLPLYRQANWCGYSQHHYIDTGPKPLPPYLKEVKRMNEKELIDSIVQIAYRQQAYDEPCVRPADKDYTLYLNGYSGLPEQSRALYSFHYTYFTD